jgi:hypothetical protein
LVPLPALPDAARPWQIYRTHYPEAPGTVRELRIEIGHPGKEGDPDRQRLVIGRSTIAVAWSPRITITSDGNVTFHGPGEQGAVLSVTGHVIEGVVEADPNDPRFTEILLEHLSAIQGAAGAGLDPLTTGQLHLTMTPSPTLAGSTVSYTVEVRNISQADVRRVQLYATLTVIEATGRRVLDAQPGALVGNLDPSDPPATRGGTLNASVTGDLLVAVLALGIGSAGNVVYALASERKTLP